MATTPVYAALMAFVFVGLSFRTIGLRRRFQVGVGHGSSPELERAIRVHANFAEYVPLSLLLVFFLEFMAGSSVWIHVLCIALLVGRILHAFGVSQVREDLRYRQVGMATTFTVIIVAAVGILFTAVTGPGV